MVWPRFSGLMDRLARQLQFILEIDKLKSIYRRTYLIDGTRHENSAEHSWHLALLAMVLAGAAEGFFREKDEG